MTELINAAEVCVMLGVSERTLHKYAKIYKALTPIRIGGRVLYLKRRVVEWIESEGVQ